MDIREGCLSEDTKYLKNLLLYSTCRETLHPPLGGLATREQEETSVLP